MKKFNPFWLLAVPLLAFLGRVAGASWGPRQVGEVSTSLAVTFVGWLLWHESWDTWFQYSQVVVPFALAVLTYAGIQSGHGNVYHMGTESEKENSPRGLDRNFGWVAKRLGLTPRSPKYCWLLMGIKGLWIGLPVFPYGLINAFFWPLSYWVSFKFWATSLYAEWISHGLLAVILLGAYYYGT